MMGLGFSHRRREPVSKIIAEDGQRVVLHHEENSKAQLCEGHVNFFPNHVVPLKEDSLPLYSHFRRLDIPAEFE
jgi:hypothetical protein